MRIIACFKMEYDLEQITPEELFLLRDRALNLSVFRRGIGSWDEAALETALWAADEVRRAGMECETVAVTMDAVDGGTVKNLYAVGFSGVTVLEANMPGRNKPMEEAALLAGYIRATGGDLILTGMQDEPEEHGQTPVLLAQMLDCPCLSNVTDLSVVERGLSVQMDTDRGSASLQVKGRAVCAVGDRVHAFLRAATLREKLAVQNQEVEMWRPVRECLTGKRSGGMSPDGKCPNEMCLNWDGNNRFPELAISRLLYEYTPRQCHFPEGDGPGSQAGILWNEYLQGGIKS